EHLRARLAGEHRRRDEQRPGQHRHAGGAQALPAIGCWCLCHGLPHLVMRIVAMPCTTNAAAAPRFPLGSIRTSTVKRSALHVPAMELFATRWIGARKPVSGGLSGDRAPFTVARRESQLRVFPNERASPGASAGTPLPDS